MCVDEFGERLGLPSLLGVPVGIVANPPLQDGERVRLVRGELLGDRPRLGLHSREQPHSQRPLGADDPTRAGELEGVTLANDPREPDRPAPGAEQAKGGAGLAVGRVGRADPDVAGERELEPAAASGAVDLGDNDRVAVLDRSGDALAQPGERLGVVSVELRNDREIGAGTECGAGATEGDNGFVGVGDRAPESLEAAFGQRVPSLRPLDRNGPDRSLAVDVDHGTSLLGVSKGLCLLPRNGPMMEQADSCRRVAIEAVTDVEPPALYELIESTLESASMLPGALTLKSAGAVAPSETTLRNGDEPDDGIVTHAAGVQLIYEGLRLTRSLAHEEPWDDADGDTDVDGDMEILAADILVARGFYLLARTDAADKAVRTVQAFGREQTHRLDERDGDDPAATTRDATLERDVLELAVLAGAAAVDENPSPSLLERAEEIAAAAGTSFPSAERSTIGAESRVSEHSLEESTTDRATSVTDT